MPLQPRQTDVAARLAAWLPAVAGARDYRTAWASFEDAVAYVARAVGARRIVEIGGGRSPLLRPEVLEGLGARCVVNDVSPDELRLAPAWVETLPGDIADPRTVSAPELRGRPHLVFSRMVFEHIADPAAAYANARVLLRDDGVLLNFIPTLFCPPFVVNACLPERLARVVLRAALRRSAEGAAPKFPAYYRWCTSTAATARRIEGVGFRSVAIQPFFGHGYYDRIPVLRDLSRRASALCARRRWNALSSYAYVVAVK